MYKLFIVDDNPLDRRGVARLCDWEALGLQVAGVYGSAMEALEAAERLVPDIVLSDIQMPVIDGIELGRRLKERHLATKLVFMSGYDDFAFARSALQLEAGDYVLKPIRRRELEAAVAKVTAKLSQERTREREMDEMLRQLKRSLPLHQEQFMRELLFGTLGGVDAAAIRKRTELLELRFPADGRYRVLLLETAAAGAAGEDAIPGYVRLMHHLGGQMAQPAEAEPPQPEPTFLRMVPVSDRQLVLIAGSGDGAGRDEMKALDWVLRAEEATDRTAPLLLSIGVSREGSFAELPKLYAQAVRALDAKFYSDRQPRVVFCEEIDEDNDGARGLPADAEELRQDVRELLFAAEEAADARRLFAKYAAAGEARLTEREVKGFMLLLSHALQQLYVEAGKPMTGWLGASLQAWERLDKRSSTADLFASLDGLIALARSELIDQQTSYYDKIVHQVKAIVARRYPEQLTIQEIADEVFLSLSHANNVFKNKTGQKIFDYLTEFRMEKAKALLRDRDSRIYQVAQQVGYGNKSHFCLIFKKYTGLAPSAYKSQFE